MNSGMNGYTVGADGRKQKDGFICASNTKTRNSAFWCVAVKIDDCGAHVRNSKDENDITLTFSREEWKAFVEGVKKGEFDIT